MSIEAETPSLEEVSDAELEKHIGSSPPITLSDIDEPQEAEDDEEEAEDEEEEVSAAEEEMIADADSSASTASNLDTADSDIEEGQPEEAAEQEDTGANPGLLLDAAESGAKGVGTPPVGGEWSTPADDEGDETDTDDEEFFQKLEADINTDNLVIYHPELMQNNYQEIKALCKVVRNKKGAILDPLHTTIPFLTKYEKARVLGVRCKQLNNGADAFVTVPPNIISGMLIAEEELKEKKIPFIIRRPLPNGGSEYWYLEDLEIIEY